MGRDRSIKSRAHATWARCCICSIRRDERPSKVRYKGCERFRRMARGGIGDSLGADLVSGSVWGAASGEVMVVLIAQRSTRRLRAHGYLSTSVTRVPLAAQKIPPTEFVLT